jgi:hypothetical protein
LKKKLFHTIVTLLLFCFAQAQNPAGVLKGIGSRVTNIGQGGSGGGGGNDSLRTRNKFEDSLTVTVFYLDSIGLHHFDSSINDFSLRFPIPFTHVYLGNTGSATRSILFEPRLRAGWDPGFHAFDVYKWKVEDVKFYRVTRPYTEFDYLIASRSEQIINLVHTQNIKPNWNFSLNYRLINAPGFFRNQKTNHNNYLFTSWYQSPSKRYNNYFLILGNRLQAGENGGLRNQRDLDTIIYAKDRFLIPTNIGGDPASSTDFFNTTIYTGNQYREFNILLRQQYDLGKKDSVVTDSTVTKLFYPRLRFEHTFKYGKYSYSFKDLPASGNVINVPDSQWYHDNYGVTIPASQSLLFRDRWKEVSNDFSIYQYPDTRNLQQFIKLGAELQLLKGDFYSDSIEKGNSSLFNVMAHGEYRNRTKNRKWDMVAAGQLYLNGYNLGDYHAFVSLERLLNQRFGSFQLGFENVNRKAPFIYDPRSGFYLDVPKDFNKENTTHLFASFFLQKLRIQLGGDYYLIGNYLYLTDYRILHQESTLFNVVRVNAMKTFRIGKHWNLHSEIWLQQKTGSAQVNIPGLFTRQRFLYEGDLGFPNLNIVFGLEARYHTPYKADNYSPVLGQFFFQDTVTISNTPDLTALLHFRIRSFKAFIRAENLNTLRFLGGLQFNNNNLAAPGYATPGLVLRLGIYWSFVN